MFADFEWELLIVMLDELKMEVSIDVWDQLLRHYPTLDSKELTVIFLLLLDGMFSHRVYETVIININKIQFSKLR